MIADQADVSSPGLPSTTDPMDILAAVPGIVALIDESGTVLWISEPMAELSGYRREDLIGTNMADHLDPAGNAEALASIGYALTTPGRRLPTVLRFLRRDGTSLHVEATANNQIHNPAIRGLVVHLQPCEERQLLDNVLEGFVAGQDLGATIGQIHAVAAAETLGCGSALVRLHGVTSSEDPLLASDEGVAALTAGRSDGDPWMVAADADRVVEVPVEDLGPARAAQAIAQGYASCWCLPVSRAGTDFIDAVLVLWRRQSDPPEPNAAVMAAKLVKLCELVLERVEHSHELEHAAAHDTLTGLANRATFFDAVEGHLDEAAGHVGVLYLDLDRFKPINDRLGHGLGDRVLQEVAARLRGAVRPTDTVARLGGDELAVVCPDATLPRLQRLAERLVAVVAEPLDLDGTAVTVGVSIGSALCRTDVCSADRLVAEADAALLQVKAEAKGSWMVVDVTS